MSFQRSLSRKLFPVLAGSALCSWALAAPVDINTADADALARALRGVGTKTAAEIVAHRERNGPFEAPEDLLEVKGIGPKTLDLNRPDILIGAGRAGKVSPGGKAKPQ